MKILKSIFILSLIALTVSCSNNDDDGGEQNNNAAFQMDVDGETVSFDATFVVAQMTNEGAYIAITAGNPTTGVGGAVAIGSVGGDPDPLAEGTYMESEEDNTSISYSFDGNSFGSFGEGGSGTVTITALDTSAKTISGTFSGVVTNLDGSVTYTITNGVFNVTYLEQ